MNIHIKWTVIRVKTTMSSTLWKKIIAPMRESCKCGSVNCHSLNPTSIFHFLIAAFVFREKIWSMPNRKVRMSKRNLCSTSRGNARFTRPMSFQDFNNHSINSWRAKKTHTRKDEKVKKKREIDLEREKVKKVWGWGLWIGIDKRSRTRAFHSFIWTRFIFIYIFTYV